MRPKFKRFIYNNTTILHTLCRLFTTTWLRRSWLLSKI